MKLPGTIRDEAKVEGYEYFNKNIRALPKDASGKIDSNQNGFDDNDVDAFRHAYVSGVFTHEYGEHAADVFGRLNELNPADIYSNSTNPGSRNMDLWNNSIGRKYGLKFKDRKSLLKAIHKALKNGELITDPKDKRQYTGTFHDPINKEKPVIVLQEKKNGRNEWYYDTVKNQVLTVTEFIVLIQQGHYPGYAIKNIHGVATPVSNPDGRKTNNLG